MKSIIKILTGFLVLTCLVPFQSFGQSHVISRSSAEGSAVIIAWEPLEGAAGYMIYRKESLSDSYPSTPINPTRISALTNCTTIKGLLLNPDSTNWKILSIALGDEPHLFNPCDIASITPDNAVKYARLRYLSAINLPIAKAAGLAFEDATTVDGQQYYYKVTAVDSDNNQIEEIATALSVTAGQVRPVNPPKLMEAEAGDNCVLVTWETDNLRAAGHRVFRAISPGGFYQRVNKTDFALYITNKLNGDTLRPARHGFFDFQRFDTSGVAVPHEVHGALINGPKNDFEYYYKIQAVDLLGRPGPMSIDYVKATPRDQTAPGVPDGITTLPDETSLNGSVEISWRHVTHDVNGHFENPGVSAYKIYRFEQAHNPDTTATLVITLNVPFSTDIAKVITAEDHSPGLRPMYGDKTWWYRVKAVDYAGNESNWSAAIKATLKDITKPEVPKGLMAESFEDRVELIWNENTEPDLNSYQIYRSFCHYGEWVPCPEPEPEESVNPDCPPEKDKIVFQEATLATPCSGPFVFLGEISADSLLRAKAAGHAAFIDYSIPDASPLCYAFWIKAVDQSGNASGDFPYPNTEEQFNIVCERLRDKTPPEPAIISGLLSRDHAIKVEWIGPPTQDTRAYHVYRAEETYAHVEPDIADFTWIGGLTIERPPVLPTPLTAPYTPGDIPTCGIIPVEATEEMSSGSFLDLDVEPHINYWYKVTGIDYDGNETEIKEAVSVSSFTFETASMEAATIEIIVAQADTCAVRLEWFPIFDVQKHFGFLVYKSLKKDGPFIQAGTMTTQNFLLDREVVSGQQYWYKIIIVQRDGKLSEESIVRSITPQ